MMDLLFSRMSRREILISKKRNIDISRIYLIEILTRTVIVPNDQAVSRPSLKFQNQHQHYHSYLSLSSFDVDGDEGD